MRYANSSHADAGNGPKSKWFAFWMWVLLFTLVGPAFQLVDAQANAGLTGTVTDPSGAVVVSVPITFRNEATGVVSHFAASSNGVYTAALAVVTCPPGSAQN